MVDAGVGVSGPAAWLINVDSLDQLKMCRLLAYVAIAYRYLRGRLSGAECFHSVAANSSSPLRAIELPIGCHCPTLVVARVFNFTAKGHLAAPPLRRLELVRVYRCISPPFRAVQTVGLLRQPGYWTGQLGSLRATPTRIFARWPPQNSRSSEAGSRK